MFRKVLGTLLVLASNCSVAWAAGRPCDAINLSQATVWNSPSDIASWPVTGAITQLSMRPGQSAGLSFVFPQHNTWPNYTPPGWDGPIQYTVWAAVRINGQWHTSGIVQMWRERPSTGAPILTDFAQNWVYDSRWGAMAHYQPQVGEQMGFFVSAGNARGVGTVTSVRERTNVVVVSLPAGDTGDFTFPASCAKTAMDLDGDGKAEIGVYRPSTGQWWGLASSTNYTTSAHVSWGAAGDIPVPGDYDGDGKTDLAVYRPSNGVWYILNSSANFTTSNGYTWGASADIPVPGDYDGDGKADLAVYRPSNGTWFVLKSSTGYTGGLSVTWGASTDIPVPGDYDGDGVTDIAVFRPSTGTWYILTSSSGYRPVSYVWGGGSDVPVPGDYDGDGKTDIAVYRPSNGTWYILTSGSGFTAAASQAWGVSTDVPSPADYDGDGKTDLAVYRPLTGDWFILKSSTGFTAAMSYKWGASTDIPILRAPYGAW
jgi:FG-GAP-like repeat